MFVPQMMPPVPPNPGSGRYPPKMQQGEEDKALGKLDFTQCNYPGSEKISLDMLFKTGNHVLGENCLIYESGPDSNE